MGSSDTASRRGSAFAHLALIVVAAWLPFAAALDAEFLDWDDGDLLVKNLAYRGFSFEHLRWMFTTTHMGPYQPLSWLSYALDHAFGGMDARVYHRTNLMLHCVGSVALYFLARRVLGSLFTRPDPDAQAVSEPSVERALSTPAAPSSFAGFGALATALLFALHPLRVESVVWCTERRDVLAAPFFFLALHAWWGYATRPNRRDYALALVLLLLSLLAKASAMVMPALLVVLDLGPLREAARARGLRRLVLEKLPVLALVIPFMWIAAVGQAKSAALATYDQHALVTRVLHAGYAAAWYVARMTWPSGLHALHRSPPPEAFLEPRILLPASAALALTIAAVFLRRRVPAFTWAWFAYLVILAPVSGLVKNGYHLVAERYSHLACVPFALLAGAGLAAVASRSRRLAWGVLVLAAAPLAWRTREYVRVWCDSRSLWTHTLAHDPDNDTALGNLAALELETAQTLRDTGEAWDTML
ncbi:MAG: hypothetical protein HZA53_08820, partial [Planctomycetes bacterium]|nr:hypothetical protein [Planctomycetota bacterium]